MSGGFFGDFESTCDHTKIVITHLKFYIQNMLLFGKKGSFQGRIITGQEIDANVNWEPVREFQSGYCV